MKRSIMPFLAGFFATVVALFFIDYILFTGFLEGGYINNPVVGGIISFQLMAWQALSFVVPALTILAVLYWRDYAKRGKFPYSWVGKRRLVSFYIGVIAATTAFTLPFMQPSDYQYLLSWAIIFASLLIVRRKLLTKKSAI